MANVFVRSLGRWMLALSLFGLSGWGVVRLQFQHLQQMDAKKHNAELADAQQTLSLKTLNRMPKKGFGFNNLVADWSFLRFLNYYGDEELRAKTGYGVGPAFFDVITSRDPRFVDSYVFLSGTLSHNLGQPELGLKYMQRGLDVLSPQQHSRAYQVPSLMGMDQLLLLGDTDAASRSYAKAAQWAKESPDPTEHSVGRTFDRVSNYLSNDPNSTRVRHWAWSSIFDQAVAMGDRQTESRARSELLALGSQEVKDAATGRVSFTLPPQPSPQPSPKASPQPSPKASPTASPASPTASPTASPSVSPNPSPTVAPQR